MSNPLDPALFRISSRSRSELRSFSFPLGTFKVHCQYLPSSIISFSQVDRTNTKHAFQSKIEAREDLEDGRHQSWGRLTTSSIHNDAVFYRRIYRRRNWVVSSCASNWDDYSIDPGKSMQRYWCTLPSLCSQHWNNCGHSVPYRGWKSGRRWCRTDSEIFTSSAIARDAKSTAVSYWIIVLQPWLISTVQRWLGRAGFEHDQFYTVSTWTSDEYIPVRSYGHSWRWRFGCSMVLRKQWAEDCLPRSCLGARHSFQRRSPHEFWGKQKERDHICYAYLQGEAGRTSRSWNQEGNLWRK